MDFDLFSWLDPGKWEDGYRQDFKLPFVYWYVDQHFCFTQMFHELDDQNSASGF